jgi:hypothetical protein
MLTVKEKVSEIIQAQTDDSSFDEILRELAFSRMAEINWTAETECWLRDIDDYISQDKTIAAANVVSASSLGETVAESRVS